MKILITGNLGYVGPVLMRHLRRVFPDAQLIGYDNGYFGHCLTNAHEFPERLADAQLWGDIRDIDPEALVGVDAVVQLSAVSNDPMGNRYEAVTEAINYEATKNLAVLAKQAGVKHFVFASSCSMYGFAEGGPRRETDELNPLTAYARSKVASEKALAPLAGDGMVNLLDWICGCILIYGTLFGVGKILLKEAALGCGMLAAAALAGFIIYRDLSYRGWNTE